MIDFVNYHAGEPFGYAGFVICPDCYNDVAVTLKGLMVEHYISRNSTTVCSFSHRPGHSLTQKRD